MTERLYLFDTTLRDGQQTSGVDFSLADKIRIANALDNLGLDYIEGGYPVPTDRQPVFCRRPQAETRRNDGLWHDKARRSQR